MINEEKKYLAYTFNVAGFAFVTPIGKIVLEPISTFNQFGFKGFIFYLIFCLVLGGVGIISIILGKDIIKV